MIGHNSFILTLFIFIIYLQINLNLLLSLSILKRTDTIQKTMNSLLKFNIKNQISIILGMYNEPIIEDILILLLQNKI